MWRGADAPGNTIIRALMKSDRRSEDSDYRRTRLRVLLSAFTCRPGTGSEWGIGWNWAVGVARLGYRTWVITPSHYRASIEAALSSAEYADIQGNLYCVYSEVPVYLSWLKITPDGTRNRVYHVLWQWYAYKRAKTLYRSVNFQLVHHVSFGSITHPTFMGRLGIPFIFGPAGGGERAPWRLRRYYGFRGHVFDALRDIRNVLTRWNPLMRDVWRRAHVIYVSSDDSARLVPKRFRSKIRHQQVIGTPHLPAQGMTRVSGTQNGGPERSSSYNIVFVGRIVFWKGIGLTLATFAALRTKIGDARLTIVGQGRDERRFRRLADTLDLAGAVTWLEWVPHEHMPAVYARCDVLLFPSLHDSGGTVVLEAMAHGLPVVCLDLGGPGLMVDASCGRRISTAGKGAAEVIAEMRDALVELSDTDLRRDLAQGALRCAERHSWTRRVSAIYGAEAPSGQNT